MSVTVRSFAKINLGLSIGPLRPDGFHDLRTVYQTIALHDIIRVQVGRGSGIEIAARIPAFQRWVEYLLSHDRTAVEALRARGRVTISIESGCRCRADWGLDRGMRWLL